VEGAARSLARPPPSKLGRFDAALASADDEADRLDARRADRLQVVGVDDVALA
jgi:hypothetical protein